MRSRVSNRIWDITWFTFLSAIGHDVDPSDSTSEVVTHRAALPFRYEGLLAVLQDFTLNVITDGDAVLADAHATGLWFPDVVVRVDLPVHRAVFTFLFFCGCCGFCTGRWPRRIRQAHWAALALWGHALLTVLQVGTHHVLTHSGPLITHTDPARLRVPHVIVGVDFSIVGAGIFGRLFLTGNSHHLSQRDGQAHNNPRAQ